eukprot:3866324-Rhodomonas_salina.1
MPSVKTPVDLAHLHIHSTTRREAVLKYASCDEDCTARTNTGSEVYRLAGLDTTRLSGHDLRRACAGACGGA